VRRRFAFFLVAIGLVALVTGIASGCGSLFSFNGRHPVAVEPLVPGTPLRKAFPAKAGKRYTLAVQVVFEREGLPEVNGQVTLEAKLPLVASIEDTSGVAVAKAVGWIDPNEPPTVLMGRASDAHQRRPMGMGPAELVAERLVGPVTPAVDRDVTYAVDLGTDRIGKTSVKEARLVLYDDTLPRSIHVAFTAAGAGALAFVAGSIMLFFGLFRSRRGGKRRGQVV
jgi:hypothetical protein